MNAKGAMASIVFVWLLLAALFGVNLYFSENHSILNPVVSLVPSVAKDVFWLFAVVMVSCYGRQSLGNHFLRNEGIKIIVLVNLGMLVIWVLAATLSAKNGLDVGYVKLFKNMILYGTLTYIMTAAAYDDLGPAMYRYVKPIITGALAFSCLLYFLIEPGFKVLEEPRLFGTFGNPNTAGLMAFLSFSLAVEQLTAKVGDHMNWMIVMHIVIATIVLILAASLSALLMLIVFLAIRRPILRTVGIRDKDHVLAYCAVSLIIAVAVVWLGYALTGVHVILYKRITDLFHGYSDSTIVRINDLHYISATSYAFILEAHGHTMIWVLTKILRIVGLLPPDSFHLFDGVIFTFLWHFGVMGVVVVLLPFLTLFIIFIRNLGALRSYPNTDVKRRITISANALLVAGMVSLPLQHQFQIFPANFFLAFFICQLILQISSLKNADSISRKNKAKQRLGPPAS